MRSDSMLILVTSVLIIKCVAVTKSAETYEFGRDCKYFTKYLDETDKIYVEYKGRNVESICNTFKFKGRGVDLLDEYKVCIEPVFFNDTDCGVILNIKSFYNIEPVRTITCNLNKDEKYCGLQDETIYIDFSSSGSSSAKFRFIVTAKKMYLNLSFDDRDATVKKSSFGIYIGQVVGLVIGGLILITAVTAALWWCLCRRKSPERRLSTPVQVPANSSNYVQYSSQLQPNNTYVFTTTGASAPVSQPRVQNQTKDATNPQHYDWSTPPPSYDSVIESSTNDGPIP